MIRPLDLQTLYMNLEKVGKDQANSKEAMAQAQAAQVERLQKEHDRGQHAVGRVDANIGPEGENSISVKADGGGSGSQPRPRSETGQAGDEEKKGKKETTWKDPELGKHVDISG